LIDQEANLETVIAGRQPLVHRTVVGIPGHHVLEDQERCDAGDRHTAAGHRVCAIQRGNTRQNKPAMMAPSKWCQRNQQVELLHFHVNPSGCPDHPHGWSSGCGTAPRESPARCRLGGGDSQDEEHEDLPGKILQVVGKSDEVHVHRQQHQLDRHQYDDQVLAVEEDADDADRKGSRPGSKNGTV
jgi:hypothetical protein